MASLLRKVSAPNDNETSFAWHTRRGFLPIKAQALFKSFPRVERGRNLLIKISVCVDFTPRWDTYGGGDGNIKSKTVI